MRSSLHLASAICFLLSFACVEPRTAPPGPAIGRDAAPEVKGTGGAAPDMNVAATGGTGGSASSSDAADVPAPPSSIDAPATETEPEPDLGPAPPPPPPPCVPAANYCCSDMNCPAMASKVGKCDLATHACQYACEGATKPCGGVCIPEAGCCDPNACPNNFACVSNACSTSACKTGYKLCGATCIPGNACCEDKDCGGNFACVGQACSKSQCKAGFKLCSGKCIAANACCTHQECGRCQKCSGNQCMDQSNEDVKGECGANKCGGGRCNDCNPSEKATCKDGNTQRDCKASGGHYAYADTACDRGCGSGGTCCGSGSETSNGGACTACGGSGQTCCTRGGASCGGGRSCKPQNVCCGASENYCAGTGGGKGCQPNVVCDASRWPYVGIRAEQGNFCGFVGNGGKQTGMEGIYPYYWQVGSCDGVYMKWAQDLCALQAFPDPGALPDIYIDSHLFDANGGNPVWSRAYTCKCTPEGGVASCVKS